MTEEIALNVLLTGQLVGNALGSVGPLNTERLSEIAETIANASDKTKRIRRCVRLVPDWIGRLPARIDPTVLQAAIDSLGEYQKLQLDYTNHQGNSSSYLVNPQGLVAKDGTVYLLATTGLENRVRHFALHRSQNAYVHSHPIRPLPGFNIDRYIEESHQLSHLLDANAAPVLLKLRVAPETIYHFSERPLSTDQTITSPANNDAWFLVTATVHETILLIPFLLSMGGWIEVLEPAKVRAETARRLAVAVAHYDP
jgi:predicted DNA-binding transcriptional regulator YafY